MAALGTCGDSSILLDDPLEAVRSSTAYVVENADDVSIDDEAVQALAASLTAEQLARLSAPPSLDPELHYMAVSAEEDNTQGGGGGGTPLGGSEAAPGTASGAGGAAGVGNSGEERTAQYLLVVDALNFCFWPEQGLEYEHLARGLKASLEADPCALDASRLAVMDGTSLRHLLACWPGQIPLEEERARLLREVGQALQREYGGKAANLVRSAKGSAGELVRRVTAAFPGFRDSCVYKGRQVFLYKRAQIFVGDLWGAFGGRGLGGFGVDIGRVTMFADYRVPVVLRQKGLLRYSPRLAAKVDAREQLLPGSPQEVEIRAATVQAVERLRAALEARTSSSTTASTTTADGIAPAATSTTAADDVAAAAAPAGTCDSRSSNALGCVLPAAARPPPPNSVQLDWWLWELGEAERDVEDTPAHHRTLTVFY